MSHVSGNSNWVLQAEFVDDLILASHKFPDAIGFQRLTKQLTEEPCDKGCMAPGSSPHYHTEFAGWRVVFEDHIIEVGADLVPHRDSVLYRPLLEK